MQDQKIAPEAREALEHGDIEALLAFQRARFGGFVMEEPGQDGQDDEDDAGGDEGAEDGDADKDDEGEYTPPTKEEWKRTQEALKKANGQAKKYRLEAAKVAQNGSGETSKEVEKAILDTEAKWKPRLVNTAARAALLGAGAKKADRLVRLIDYDDLEISDEGEVEGLEVQIQELRNDYPELFGPENGRRKRPGSADAGGGKGRPPQKQMSSAERIAAGLRGDA